MRFQSIVLRIAILIFIISGGTAISLHAQENRTEELLLHQIQSASNETEKINRLHELISFYYAFNFETKADSLREIQIIKSKVSILNFYSALFVLSGQSETITIIGIDKICIRKL